MDADAAARIVTLYYAGMALGRFASGVIAGRLHSWKIIKICEGVVLAAIVLLALPLPTAWAGAGLFMIGFGNGPIFPNLTHLTPANFGKDISQSVISSQMAASYAGMVAMPPLFGILAQRFGAVYMPYYLMGLFAVMISAHALFIRMHGKRA